MKLKHDLMYELYGTDTAHICKDCCNFCHCIARSGRRWSKCAVYGVSWCNSTDWNGKKAACGRFDIPLKGNERTVIELKRHSKKEKEQIQCEGQISLI